MDTNRLWFSFFLRDILNKKKEREVSRIIEKFQKILIQFNDLRILRIKDTQSLFSSIIFKRIKEYLYRVADTLCT